MGGAARRAQIGYRNRSLMARMPKQPLITIVVDDESVRQALMGLMRAFGFVSKRYPCAEDFLRSGRLRCAA
jgi:FixJ family two-component response regulator